MALRPHRTPRYFGYVAQSDFIVEGFEMGRVRRKSDTKSRRSTCIVWGLIVAYVLTAVHSRAVAQSDASQSELDRTHLPAWQIAAGTKSEFEVASIRLAKPDTF